MDDSLEERRLRRGNALLHSEPSQSKSPARFTPAYVVSLPDITNAVSQWQQAGVLFNDGSETYVSIERLQNWAIPWLQNRLIHGRMARWKAIYLLNGFDSVWSVLQALQRLAAPNPAVVPATMTLNQDDTTASGNWSARELCAIVLADNEFVVNSGSVSGHSVAGFVEFLYNIANGNWAAPPGKTPGQTPLRPLSFRGLLASAAI
jgi:hypothetical protein